MAKVFPNSKFLLCAWHVEQNLKKRTLYLNKGKNKEKKKLFTIIKNLPYAEYEDLYLTNYNLLKNSKDLDDSTKKYLQERHNHRELWVKCFVKKNFTCGMVASSRIESKHSVFKKNLDDTTRLSEIFTIFNNLEQQEIQDFTDELNSICSKENVGLDQNDLIKKFKEQYGEYIILKIKREVLDAINYQVEKIGMKW